MAISLPRFLFSILHSRLSRKPRVWRANVAVTKECHSRCQNCDIWRQGKSADELSLEEFRRVGREMPGLRWLSLTGGEPTDRADLPEIVRAFNQRNNLFLVNFSTNGLNQARVLRAARAIAQLGIPRFVVAVSIDGPPRVNDALRGIPGDFARAMSTFSALVRFEKTSCARMKAFVSMTLFRENAELVEEMLRELAAHEGFATDRLHLNIGHASRHLYGNTPGPYRNLSVRAAMQALLRHRRIRPSFQEGIERLYQRLAVRYSPETPVALPCAAVKASVHINEKGEVFPCTVWDKSLGNLRGFDYSLESLLREPAAAEIRRSAQKRDCPNCWTPCEAYQTIAAHPLRSSWQSFLRT